MKPKSLYGRFAAVLANPAMLLVSVVAAMVAPQVTGVYMQRQVWEVQKRCKQIDDLEKFADCSNYETSRWQLLLDLQLVHLVVVLPGAVIACGVVAYWLYWFSRRRDEVALLDEVHAAKIQIARRRAGRIIAATSLFWLVVVVYFCVEAVVWSYIVV